MTTKTKAKETDPETPETPEPLSGDDLIEAVETRRAGINPRDSSYAQGRHEELTWVLDQINPQPAEQPEPETETETETEAEPFAEAT